MTLGAHIERGDEASVVDQRPIRGELFGATRLAEHARRLARRHKIAPIPRPGWIKRRERGPLLSRLEATEKALIVSRDTLARAAAAGAEVSPAGVWLLDNFFVVLEQVPEIRATLPTGYYQELPKLAGGGALAEHPRIYAIVIELIAHTDGRLDEPTVALMIREYQRVAPLTMGELWAIPAMLRMGYLENVRRMALRAARDVADRALADEWVSRLLDIKPLDDATGGLSSFVHGGPPLTPAFLTRFLQQIRSRRSDFTPLLWLEQWVAEDVMTVEDAAQRSVQELALTQLVMANSIASLRSVASIDWTEFVETASATEAVLRGDPSGTYATMTRATRDQYRHAVERIAKGTSQDEPAVAAIAIDAARAASAKRGPEAREAHVGYHLVGEGERAFERTVGYRAPPATRASEWMLVHPSPVYFGALLVAVGLALAAFVAPLPLEHLGGARAGWLAVALLLALFPAADVAVAVVNQLVNVFVPPARLPRLDYERSVPERDRTAVVVPLLFGSVESVAQALEHIEVQHLANRDRQIRFALLSDFLDSPTETAPGDDAIVAAAIEGVRALNASYGGADTPSDPPFYLLHRSRRWNAADQVWMGWERKRGKLVDFNSFITGENDHAFAVAEGDLPWLRTVRYAVTLDADTVLPRGAAAALIGTIAHPLNRAEYDAERGRVVRGYGILQPRVSVSLASASESRFASVYAGHPGVDPYTTAVSDVYQDLFGEGTFTGKGIYDVAVFSRATEGRFPENTLLSHDLIEGTFARAGLVTDVEVFDDYPTRYLTSTRRTHRWIRGDWQLLRWLTPRVPGLSGSNLHPLSALSRWKIADNMRRSLSPVALLLWLVAGWTVLPGSWLAWTATALAALGAPWIAPLLFAAARPPRGKGWRPYYAALAGDASRASVQLGLAVILLPDQALLATDAVVRSLVRVLRSHRRMLEWQTASQVEGTTGYSRLSVWKRMWPAVLLSAAIVTLVAWRAAPSIASGATSGAMTWAAIAAFVSLALAWLLVPEAAIALSAPLTRSNLVLDADQRATTLRYALRHWRYFERFVTAETHWLVPDNFQETPEPVIASRTSPTNMGLQLLATMSACDLGFLTRGEMLDRLERAFDSMGKMSRVRGHFFNWYDLGDLRVLDPPYISTVDSGNLAGHLVALAQGCLALADAPVDDARLWAVLDAEGVQHHGRDAAGVVTPWVGERMVAYQAGTLDLRRQASLTASSPDATATMLWARQRLEAAGTELALLELDAEEHAGTPLRVAARTSPAAAKLVDRLEAMAKRARDTAMAMDFRFVYDEHRRLLAIGCDPRSGRLDESSYDLLASESRLASFIAVAKGDAPAEHWFRLGRSLTVADGATALVSWSGSMFEYLMPLLVMPARPFSLLDQTCHSAVHRQIAYASARGVPWGISESAYNVRDRHDTYQYRAFGVPDLALKRGLASDLVVAPYATALAAAVDVHHALRNFAELERHGALGAYGFYDALDYTRVGEDERAAVVRTFMAHHVGMSLVALDNALSIGESETAGIWQRRFMADAAVRAAALLLDERVPRSYVPRPPQADVSVSVVESMARTQIYVHDVDTPHTPEPHVALLGGSGYSVLLTNAGSGHSRANGIDVLRWRADATQDDTGQWIYIKDLTAGTLWSAAHQPVRATPSSYRASFATDRVSFDRRDGAVETRTEIVVISSEQAEIRRVTLVNRSRVVREIELTSYGEVVLCPADADRAHQAFQKLFVETEWVPAATLLASRRPRSSEERWPWCAHVVASGPERVGDVTYETDRARFIGRGRTVHSPHALDADASLSGSVGAVLDPIVALRVRVRIEPGRSATVAFTTAVANTREAALQLADRYRDVAAAERALSLARTEAEVELRDLDIAPTDVALYQELAGALIYPHEALRAPEHERAAVTLGQSALWAQGISGDWPIVLATIRAPGGLASIRQLLVAHRYWRSKGIRSDLVILNAKPHSYAQELQDQIVTMAMASGEGGVLERPGGVFIRRADVLSPADTALLRATARVHILCDGIGLGEIVAANILKHHAYPSVEPNVAAPAPLVNVPPPETRDSARASAHANGYGGLTAAGDYTIDVAGARVPPAPWANVVANPAMGFCITERGGGFTWAENSLFFRLTPWFNDPVCDPCGEVLYLRDLDSGDVWTPTPGPAAAVGKPALSAEYTATHAPGATTFAHERGGIATELTLAVPRADAVKIARLRITNRGAASRRLSLTSYVEWVLGAEREHTRHQLHTRHDAASGALFAQNYYAPDFTTRVAFSWISEKTTSYTSRRDHFIGRNGDPTAPAGLIDDVLGGAVGAGYDPCAALRCAIALEPDETRTIVILLGAGASDDDARTLIERHGSPQAADASIADATAAWEHRLSAIAVRTPEPELDALLNRWSLYQALACRMWARSALYQSSGAYGFRDQLQDCMAFVYAEPAVARAHILRAAARQFTEGDVQHWWHEPSGRGIRTRFSDDLVWLPFVADHYVRVTGDGAIWDAPAPYLNMRLLHAGEQEAYEQPTLSDESSVLYEHCVRALDRACTTGVHGLPLMGAGDWNDGMNRVGVEGKGESVWLAWFLTTTLRRFAVHALARGDRNTAARCQSRADAYAAAVEREGWDGAWYRRAYFDDGTPLGAAANDECQIDSIAQSWAVLSGAGDPARARAAMQAVNERLVRDDARMVLLLTPPFDKSDRDPGYIKGYLPGVRENGAQYTHAALWTVLAMAKLGDGGRAGELMRMLNPLSHARTAADADTYKVEPYVVAADVYAATGHEGRGGWTWYTGSASWSYRVALEGILGFEKRGDRLHMDPCIPTAWPGFMLDYRHGASTYAIEVRNPNAVSRGVVSVSVDGAASADGAVTLIDDGTQHTVVVVLGSV
ncbi:MAG: putative cyclic beta 1-2 glucan synthetase [Gemmatimonadetes bacterium]|nr:putative cyclic beta 1-2 glucan synthetase [Gemmatimonadota bacterium]